MLMDRSPRVSVVVASYNYEDFVVETLDSLWQQTFRDFEIVVVDDGSTDGSVRAIRKFMEEHANDGVAIRLLTHADGGNHGLPATIALGVKEAKGEFVAFCESDDLWTPDHLEKVMQAVDESGGQAEIVANDVELFGNPARCADFERILRSRRARLRSGRNRISPAKFRDANYVMTFSSAMAKRSALLECDFNPVARKSALDWWLWRQLCYDRPLWYVDHVLTRWRMHESQMTLDHADPEYVERQRDFIAAGSALLRSKHPITSLWRLVLKVPPDPLGWRKRMRGMVKRLTPYAMQRSYAERTYGIVFPDCVSWPGVMGKVQGAVIACLPFGLVCRLYGFDPDNGVGGDVPTDGRQPTYRMSRSRRLRMLRERDEGMKACAEEVERNRDVRIAVLLHLYYDSAWQTIVRYLDNLKPYAYDLVVTATEERISGRTLAAVRAYAPSVRIVSCANRGYDVWPFVRALEEIDLSRYDVVFKLHSKGISRPFIFMYDQVFKRSDWFYNLFDGVLGGMTVHKAIDAIAKGGAKLVAAENLIVADPKHKRSLVKEFCVSHGLDFVDDYRFVAGTCFAVRSDVLTPLKKLGLSADDFEPARRGVFSAAHAIERWMCFPAVCAMRGMPVERNEYTGEAERCRMTSSLRLLEDPRFDLDADFFYRVLEPRKVERYEVSKIRLGDIRRITNDGRIVPLVECEPFRYLRGETEAYDNYCRANRLSSGFAMSPARFDALRESMSEYDSRKMPVLWGDENILMDGQHRCCILLDRFGPDREIEVLRLW